MTHFSISVAYLNLGQTLETTSREKEAETMYTKCVKLDVKGLKDPRTHDEAKSSCLRLLKRLCAEKGCGSVTSKIISDKVYFGQQTFFTQLAGFETKQNRNVV